ncbi:hypothetical protein B5F53_03660 [Blautia sp. An249]|uniref:SPOR domain-containing protein n=1 Tax=Blautia sp. An249 TaxID=1965603 RepID=UPI000B57A39B|nr:SPOR domain-containing protein [Blautia sp. An249]OUO80860.1 hypothetical protein B5F53_03660 [Blautia sp. An249]
MTPPIPAWSRKSPTLGRKSPVWSVYKVQVGAYSVKANAEAMMRKVKAAGFDAFITTASGSAVSSSNAKSIDTLYISREVQSRLSHTSLINQLHHTS